MITKFISGWGNYKTIKSNLYMPLNINELKKIIKKNRKYTIRGMGRSYGDSSLGKNIISLNRFKTFVNFINNNIIMKRSSPSKIASYN